MAKVVGPLHSSEARGSVSSLTYNTWRGISTVKARSGPTTQYSDDQVYVRGRARLATLLWQARTDAQRDAWNHYANEHADIDWTGNPQRLSGYNWFIRINVRKQLLGLGFQYTPPTVALAYSIADIDLMRPYTEVKVIWTPQYEPPYEDLYIECYMLGPHSPGLNPNLKACDRKGHSLEYLGDYTSSLTQTGCYTCYARPVHVQGVVGVWARIKKQLT